MDLEEAVARFFPMGSGYDHTQAKRLVSWLEHCGYGIVPLQVKAEDVTPDRPVDRKAA